MCAQANQAQKHNKYFGFQDSRKKLEREDSIGLEIVTLTGGGLI